MKKILTGLLLLINLTCFSQSIKELEDELSYHLSGEEWGNKKNIAKKLLEIDNLNTRAFNYLVEVYGRNDQRDSIKYLYEKLIKDNPTNTETYLLIAQDENAHFAGLTYTQQIRYLKEAYKLDSVNVQAMYALGKLYYDLFVKEFISGRKKANLDNYSSNSIKYFSLLCTQSEKYQETLKFPLIQLANYTRDLNLKRLYENNKIQFSYFPIAAFVDLPNDWKTNYSVNVIVHVAPLEFKVSGVEFALFHINWYATHLKALEETVLSDSLPAKVFRFTWLRSFHNPIVIGLEFTNDSVTVYWKVCDGAGGYEPGKIMVNSSKKLSIKEWDDFVASIDAIDFWNLPTTSIENRGTDGAQWILEGKEFAKYHVVDRSSGGAIKNVCLKLLENTDLIINQEDIY